MRDLRTGDGPERAPEVEPTVVTSGRAPNERSFLASLGRAIALAGSTDERILVFRARAGVIGLNKWSELTAPSSDELDLAVEERVLATDPSVVILHLAGDVIGFASAPHSSNGAERLGGHLAARLAAAIGPREPRFALAPRLGVAIIEPPAQGAAGLAQAVSAALEAVERTIEQTSTETPYLIHTDYIERRSLRQCEIDGTLDRAIAERQITLEFQPRITIDGRRPVGLEVFPRWDHPELGPVATIEFLRVAERSGRLGGLGRRVRADALDLARQWAADGSLGQRRLWFDVAPVEVLSDGFLDEVIAIVTAMPELPIGFELADGPLLEAGVFEPCFDAVVELGVMLALDNVGPSTMSFGRLQKLPIGHLNLDRELVRAVTVDGGHRDLIRAICGHAKDRGIVVAACQVETEAELSALAELGVEQAQGFAVSKPLVEADVWPTLDRHHH